MSKDHQEGPNEIFVTEILHRFAIEYAGTLATLRIIKARGGVQSELLEAALVRIEAQFDIHRLLLARPTGGPIQEVLKQLCHLMLRSRASGGDQKIAFGADDGRIPNTLRRPLLMAGYGLLENALKQGSDLRKPLRMTMERTQASCTLDVQNSATGAHPNVRWSPALLMVSSLCKRWGGDLSQTYQNGMIGFAATFRIEP